MELDFEPRKLPEGVDVLFHPGPQLFQNYLGVESRRPQLLVPVHFRNALLIAVNDPFLAGKIGLETGLIPKISGKGTLHNSHPTALAYAPDYDAAFTTFDYSDIQKQQRAIMAYTYHIAGEINPNIPKLRQTPESDLNPKDLEKGSFYSRVTEGLGLWAVLQIYGNHQSLSADDQRALHYQAIAKRFQFINQCLAENNPEINSDERLMLAVNNTSVIGHITVETVIREAMTKERLSYDEAFRLLLLDTDNPNLLAQYKPEIKNSISRMLMYTTSQRAL